MDVLVSLAIHGIWIPAIPAGMTLLSLSWRVWGKTPSGAETGSKSQVGYASRTFLDPDLTLTLSSN